jgi:hypothetical protein
MFWSFSMMRSNSTRVRRAHGRRLSTVALSSVLSLVAVLAVLASGAGAAAVPIEGTVQCNDPWPLRRAMFMYTNSAMPTATLDAIADRFDFVVEGYRPDVEYMINRNSQLKFIAFYNSLTDNYVTDSAEHDWLMANAAQFGVDGEDAYLHFWEDTVVELQGQNITIPGWNPNRQSGDPPASAVNRADARAPVYFSSLSRRVTNFSSPAVRSLQRAYNLYRFNEPLIGGIHPGGVMFDNSANSSLQVRIVSGGRVAEHSLHTQFNSGEFMDWYWMQGVRVYLEELRNYLDSNRAEFGGRQIYVIPNVANVPYVGNASWEASYVNPPAAHILSLEFEYNPTRDFGASLPEIIYDKHTQALSQGVGIFETGYVFKGRSGLAGSFTDDEAIMNNLAAHWVHRADDTGMNATTYLLGVNVWDAASQPDKWGRNLAGAFDVDLGKPLGPPYVMNSGIDGKGNNFKVYGRPYTCGFAVVRHREPYDGDFDEATRVNFDLPDEYSPVDLDGNELRPESTWSLVNGEGQLFIAPSGVGNTLAPENPKNLREGN